MSDDADLILESVAELVRDVVAPRAGEIDLTAAFPRDVYEAFAQLGLLAAMIPAEHGGVDIGLETTMLVVERIAVASASCALLLGNCGDGPARRRPVPHLGLEAVHHQRLGGGRVHGLGPHRRRHLGVPGRG